MGVNPETRNVLLRQTSVFTLVVMPGNAAAIEHEGTVQAMAPAIANIQTAAAVVPCVFKLRTTSFDKAIVGFIERSHASSRNTKSQNTGHSIFGNRPPTS